MFNIKPTKWMDFSPRINIPDKSFPNRGIFDFALYFE